MKCFYHNDLDGHAAGFCVHAWAGIHGAHDQNNCMKPINYGKPFPFEEILANEQVWIVDYSIEPDEMRRLLEITQNVYWIDHHKTAIEKYSDFDIQIPGYRCDGVAGCVLTWEYMHWHSGRGSNPVILEGMPDTPEIAKDYPVPEMIKLVGDRDVWAWKFGDTTKHFFAGAQMHDTSPSSEFWWRCMEHETKDLPLPNTGNRDARIRGEKWWAQLLHDGETIERYKAQSDKGVNESIGYEVEFEGYRCFACNRARVSSDRFGGLDDQYDILLPHYHDGKQWTVSLYSKTVDVSEIAKARGGGGHKGAAGFQCSSLPWIDSKSTEQSNGKGQG